MSDVQLSTDPQHLVLPVGFKYAGVACGIKRSGKRDLSLIVADEPVVAAGVYTQNRVCAAPVVIDRERTPTRNARAVVVNSGNANACTGQQGITDAMSMLTCTADAIGCAADQVLVMSTGVIGVTLEMGSVRSGISDAAQRISSDNESFECAADGILTTDTCIKVAGIELDVEGQGAHRMAAMGKGSGMIAPNMATMLGLVATDAALTPQTAQQMLTRVTEHTFNRITVDGHTSTNDTMLLLAKPAGASPSKTALDQLEAALFAVCESLARAIVDDGEGATHRIDIEVSGCRTESAAKQIALAIANSPLVKTAVAGADPNWGRIVSAAGYAGVDFDPDRTRLTVNGFLLFERGLPVPFDDPLVSQAMRDTWTTTIQLECGEGEAAVRLQASDLTAEYVRINADYRT